MSTQTADAGTVRSQRPASARATFLSDTWVIARRGLLHMRRQPEALSDATIQPVMFVLLFAFVFGGAISVPGGGSYKEFLMGGIFAQTIVFGCFGVALALSNDRNNGAIDRFHSLPIPRSSVLAGHAVANLIRAFLPITAHAPILAVFAMRAAGSTTADLCIPAGALAGGLNSAETFAK